MYDVINAVPPVATACDMQLISHTPGVNVMLAILFVVVDVVALAVALAVNSSPRKPAVGVTVLDP